MTVSTKPTYIVLGLLLLACCLLTPVAQAQNLVTNPNFDTNLNGWNSSLGTIFDGTMDANGSPGSGSAKLTIGLSPSNFAIAISQCISGINGGTAYQFGGKLRFAVAPTGGYARVRVLFHSNSSCGANTGLVEGPDVTTTGSWLDSNGQFVAPGGTQSVFFAVLINGGPQGGGVVINMDDMFLQPQLSPVVPVPTLSTPLLILLGLTLAVGGAILAGRHRAAA